jgi:hypothetical protein
MIDDNVNNSDIIVDELVFRSMIVCTTMVPVLLSLVWRLGFGMNSVHEQYV